MRWLFDIAWLALLAFIAGTAGLLPAEVGDPGKALSREAYLAMALVHGLLVPWLATHGGLALVRWRPQLLSIPNKHYWMAEPRREATLAWLRPQLFRLGLMVVLLVAATHYLALSPTQTHWPQPGQMQLVAGAGVLGVLFIAWVIAVYRRFPAPPPSAEPRAATGRQPRRPRRPYRAD